MDKIKYSPFQLEVLEMNFRMDPYVSPEAADALSKQLNVSVKQIRVWYQNRRAKIRRDCNKQDNLLSTHSSLRSSWGSLSRGRSPSSSPRSSPIHAASAPSSPIPPYWNRSRSLTPTRDSLTDNYSGPTNYTYSTYDTSSQCSQVTTTPVYDTTGSWSGQNTSIGYSHNASAEYSPNASAEYSPNVSAEYSPNASAEYSPNTLAEYSPNVSAEYSPNTSAEYGQGPSKTTVHSAPQSPFPDTRFCEEFNSVPTIVVNQPEDDLSAYFEENARDATDASLFYGERGCIERSRSAEPATTSNYADNGHCSQLKNFSGLRMSHSNADFYANNGTYDNPQYAIHSQYSSLKTCPTGPLNHAFQSLQMQDAGQIHPPTIDDPVEQLAPSISELSSTKLDDKGDAAFIQSLTEFLNS